MKKTKMKKRRKLSEQGKNNEVVGREGDSKRMKKGREKERRRKKGRKKEKEERRKKEKEERCGLEWVKN